MDSQTTRTVPVDAQKVQKSDRLSRSFGLGVVDFFLLVLVGLGCASQLRQEQDLAKAPKELEQIFSDASSALFDQTPDSDPKVGASSDSASTEAPKPVISAATTSVPESKGAADLRGTKKKSVASRPSLAKYPSWRPKAWPFGVGEKIVLNLRWGVIDAGTATLEVLPPKVLNGEPVLHYRGKVLSSSWASLIYKVDDTLDAWTGLADHLPRRQEIRTLESKQWGRRVVVFDVEKQKADYYMHNTHAERGVVEERRLDSLEHFAQDVFGAMYFYRFVEDAENINYAVYDKNKNWNNSFEFKGRESVTVPAGTFPALKYQMTPRVSGSLEPKAAVEMWVSDTPARHMIQFKAKVRVGSVVGELLEYTPGRAFTVEPPLMRTPFNLNDLGQMK